MTRLDYLRAQYENILQWYKQCEDKAKFLVTINTIVAGVVNALVFVSSGFGAKSRAEYGALVLTLLSLAGLSLIGSFAFVLWSVWARHRHTGSPLRPDEKLWFFNHIAEMSREEYRAAVQDWSKEKLEATMTAQNHILSGNVRTKYNALNRAITLTIVAIVALFGLGIAYAPVAP